MLSHKGIKTSNFNPKKFNKFVFKLNIYPYEVSRLFLSLDMPVEEITRFLKQLDVEFIAKCLKYMPIEMAVSVVANLPTEMHEHLFNHMFSRQRNTILAKLRNVEGYKSTHYWKAKPPKKLEAIGEEKKVKLTWNGVEGAEGYYLYYGTSKDIQPGKLDSYDHKIKLTHATWHKVEKLKNYTIYYFILTHMQEVLKATPAV